MDDRKTALVTGAARGIGSAIAMKLHADGYNVAVFDLAEGMDAEETPSLIYIKGDLTSSADRAGAIEIIKQRFGRLDVLVNNAGVAPKTRLDILDTTEESMDFVLGINLKGTFFMTQLAARYMAEQVREGKSIAPAIVNISSISAVVSSVNRGEYCISKAGVSMITTLFADRLAEYGINVYEVRPGIILTDMTAKVKDKYDRLIAEGLVPFKRWGYPEDIAKAVASLCSGAFAFSTGDTIYVDGGLHIQRL